MLSFFKFSSVGSAIDSEIKAPEAAENLPSATICTILRFKIPSFENFWEGKVLPFFEFSPSNYPFLKFGEIL